MTLTTNGMAVGVTRMSKEFEAVTAKMRLIIEEHFPDAQMLFIARKGQDIITHDNSYLKEMPSESYDLIEELMDAMFCKTSATHENKKKV